MKTGSIGKDSGWDENSGDAFQQAFELTNTEMALTWHLATGGTTREFSEQCAALSTQAETPFLAAQPPLSPE